MIKSIKTIELKNFQSHKHTVLNTNSNIVLFAGESNNGKSAILRGVLWLITNRPSGIGFVSNWAKEKNNKDDIVLKRNATCEVTLVVVDDKGTEHSVSRVKTKDKNLYILDGVELEAVGTSVPESVSKLLSFQDCNMQSQDDEYFMITLTPGQVASKLNELVHLDTIDKAYEYTRKVKLGTGAVLREYDAAAAENKHKMDGYKHLPDLSDRAQEIEELIIDKENLDDTITNARTLLATIQDNKYKLEHTVSEDTPNRLEDIADMIDNYNVLSKNYSKARKYIDMYESLTTSIEAIRIPDDDQIDNLTKQIDDYTKLVDTYSTAVPLLDKYMLTSKELADIIQNIDNLSAELPDICPTCGHIINKEEL